MPAHFLLCSPFDLLFCLAQGLVYRFPFRQAAAPQGIQCRSTQGPIQIIADQQRKSLAACQLDHNLTGEQFTQVKASACHRFTHLDHHQCGCRIAEYLHLIFSHDWVYQITDQFSGTLPNDS